MTECRHGLSEDCPGCMQETIDALVKALADCLREHGGFMIKGECERNARAALALVGGTLS